MMDVDTKVKVVRVAGERVGERDGHVSVGRFGELGELRGLCRPHAPDLGVEEALVHLDAATLAFSGEAADELGVGSETLEDLPRVHTLRAVDRDESTSGTRPL